MAACYRCGHTPCDCGLERARAMLSARLRRIGQQDSRNGYTALANDVANGVGCHVDSWIAMELIADALQP